MKRRLAVLIVTVFPLVASAQENTVSAGGEATGTGGTVSYSVGQIDYQTRSGTGTIHEGVQQPFELTVGVEESLPIDFLVYPNPTQEFIVLQFPEGITHPIIQLVDAKGKLVLEEDITENQHKVDMKPYALGSYQLLVLDQTEILTTTTIIKH